VIFLLLKRKLKHGECCDDGQNHSLVDFVSGKRKCKGCKIALTDESVSLVDGYYCRYCKPVRELEDL
jgi:hypothetical protein